MLHTRNWAAGPRVQRIGAFLLLEFLALDMSNIIRVAARNNSEDTPRGPLWNAQSPPFYPSPWADGSGDWGEAYGKARVFVSQLTLLEKVNLTTGVGWQSEACLGNVGSVPRLGFDGLCLQDSPLGVRNADFVSAFPAGITIAASWDRQLMYDRGYQTGLEHRDKGVDIQLGPVVGPLGRSPTGGRYWEGFGPDPYLTGIAAGQTIKGIQNAGVVACTKHLIGNEQEHFRIVYESKGYGFDIQDSVSSNIDDKTMHELYLWPFVDAIRAGTGSIMCAMNQVNNSYSCQNSELLNNLVKNELGFQGFIMSDWQAQVSGVSSALAGLDMTMPGDISPSSGTSYWGSELTKAVLNDTVPEWRLDDMVTRIMASYFYVRREENRVPVNFNSWTQDTFGYPHPLWKHNYGQINSHVDVRRNHAEEIRRQAAESTVLLKNKNGALPLLGEEFVAIFGEDATNSPLGPNGCESRGCNRGTLAMGWGSGTAEFPYLISPLAAIQHRVLRKGGLSQMYTDNWDLSGVPRLARQAGVSLVFVNSNSGEAFVSIDDNIGDRRNLTLWNNGENLIKSVAAECNNTLVIIHSPGPVLMESFRHHPNVTAILWAGLPGQESGNSISDILFGEVNPSARLPFTIGKTERDYGESVQIRTKPNNGEAAPQVEFSEGVFVDYRYFDHHNITPAYEFGFGLSYTAFEYSDFQITVHPLQAMMPNMRSLKEVPPFSQRTDVNIEDYKFPSHIRKVKSYIYPYLPKRTYKSNIGGRDLSWLPENSRVARPPIAHPSGGGPGGHPKLWDIVATVTAKIKNIGPVSGSEVVQLYVSLKEEGEPVRVLRGFDKVGPIEPGQSAEFLATLTRRDVSRWISAIRMWEVPTGNIEIWLGGSSRRLRLGGTLKMQYL